jgi:hypothetical protein
MPRESWQTGLRRKALQVSQKTKSKEVLLVLTSLLRGLAAEIEEKALGTHTRLLSENPDIPVKYFAACIGVSNGVGTKLHKQWHEDHGAITPKGTRASAGEIAYWLGIVAKETAPK